MIDINVLLTVALALGVALVVAFVTTPLARAFARRVGAVDIPKDGRRMHNHPIPRLGGLAIFLGFIISVVMFADIERQVQGMLLGSIIIVTIGMIDDIVPLPAWLKFLFQVAAAGVAVAFGIRIERISNPAFWSDVSYINFGVWSIPITMIWIVGITNPVNPIDGLDGLAVGVSAISSMSVLVISLVLGQLNIAIILAALLGACLGFMPYNLNPARIFMGDTGALFLGYVLATVSVMGLLKFYAIISFAVPLLALGLPIFDTIFAIIRRLLKGQNPMSPDRGHFHHRLVDMGLSQKQAVAILYSISAVLGLAAVLITTSGEMRALVFLFAFCIAITIGVVLIRSMDQRREAGEHKSSGDAPQISEETIQDKSDSQSGKDDSDDGNGEGPAQDS